MNFPVVQFCNDETVEYVSGAWMVGRTQCYWPKRSGREVVRLRTSHARPEDDWELHSCRLLSVALNEKTARHRLQKAVKGFDDLTTEAEEDTEAPPPKRQCAPSSSQLVDITVDSNPNPTEIQLLTRAPSKGRGSSSGATFSMPAPPALPAAIANLSSGNIGASQSSHADFPLSTSSPNLAREASGQQREDRLLQGNQREDRLLQGNQREDRLLQGNQREDRLLQGNRCSYQRQLDERQQRSSSVGGQQAELQPPSLSSFERVVLRELAAIRQQVEENGRHIAAISSRRGVNLRLPVDLPCTTVPDANTLCDFLEIEGNMENLKRQLSTAGGRCTKDVARRILKKLMTASLMELYSFAGRKGKLAFKTTKLWETVLGACLLSTKCTDAEVENCVKDILKHAKDSK
ncbi:hypothetical protein BOX15_Mlig008587g1 [Macrostomum lignano]|uniref:DUF4806 domain-containing protein n=1 Tax=Macrostomum lignano TaxID=282301 RepID=A0A267F1X5_9PLAT|nr:hypothetical protein BOX15_Mlig008587g1 [Macrostomum lignano]